jgi:hypothetical protein
MVEVYVADSINVCFARDLYVVSSLEDVESVV